MAYPLMYLVKDLKGNVLFTSQDKGEAIKWGQRLEKMRTSVAQKRVNPLVLVSSQMIGFIDEL